MPGRYKRGILIVADSLMLIFALWLSFSLRMDVWYWPIDGVNNPIVILVLLAPVLAVPVFIQFGVYRAILRHIGMKAFFSLLKAVIIYAAFWGLLTFLSGVQGVPRSVVPINAMVAFFIIAGAVVDVPSALQALIVKLCTKPARSDVSDRFELN